MLAAGLAPLAGWAGVAPWVVLVDEVKSSIPPLLESLPDAGVAAGVAVAGEFAVVLLAAPLPLGAEVLFAAAGEAGVALGVSLRGIAWLGGGAAEPGFTCSTLTVPLPELPMLLPRSARLASCTTCVALVGLGSTRVGSPTRAASAVSGWRLKLFITRLNIPGSCRLASSALFCAMAWGVGVGTG